MRIIVSDCDDDFGKKSNHTVMQQAFPENHTLNNSTQKTYVDYRIVDGYVCRMDTNVA
jgi:hypothetical protein